MTTQKFVIKRYSENPELYREFVYEFCEQAAREKNFALTPKLYNPDDPSIETWLCFLKGKLISISALERSHYTNDPDIAVRACRYHILKDFRLTHCGLRMAEAQVPWARAQGYQILYITHDVNNKALNYLYQRKKKIPVKSFHEFTKSEWYTQLELERDFFFQAGDTLQFVYSIRLQDKNFVWQPRSKYIVTEFDKTLMDQ